MERVIEVLEGPLTKRVPRRSDAGNANANKVAADIGAQEGPMASDRELVDVEGPEGSDREPAIDVRVCSDRELVAVEGPAGSDWELAIDVVVPCLLSSLLSRDIPGVLDGTVWGSHPQSSHRAQMGPRLRERGNTHPDPVPRSGRTRVSGDTGTQPRARVAGSGRTRTKEALAHYTTPADELGSERTQTDGPGTLLRSQQQARRREHGRSDSGITLRNPTDGLSR